MRLAIFGKTPKLSLAELISLYGTGVNSLSDMGALIDSETVDIDRLGGTIKLGQPIGEVGSTNWQAAAKYLEQNAGDHLDKESKQNMGISVYGLKLSAKEIGRTALGLKKSLKGKGYSIRVVPNQAPTLNSAQVLHNKLTEKGAEFIVVAADNKMLVAKTVGVQDIDAYSERDYKRPKRDSKVGMLPPKLAQTMINLALGPAALGKHQMKEPSRKSDLSAAQGADEERTEAYKGTSKEHRKKATKRSAKSAAAQRAPLAGRPRDLTILDPFCGTGVVLQEALLMGYNIQGSDINKRMIDYTRQNLEWLTSKYHLPKTDYPLAVADAGTHTWDQPVDAVVSELDLGRPLTLEPDPDQLAKLRISSRKLISSFLKNLSNQLAPGTPVVLAIPIWRVDNQLIGPFGPQIEPVRKRPPQGGRSHSPQARAFSNGFDQLARFGYNRKSFAPVGVDDMVYIRPQQFTGRKIIVLERV